MVGRPLHGWSSCGWVDGSCIRIVQIAMIVVWLRTRISNLIHVHVECGVSGVCSNINPKPSHVTITSKTPVHCQITCCLHDVGKSSVST